MMMESKGLNVIDLGNSVPPAKYIEAAAKHNADIIACSALLTTTMVHIKDVVKGVAESPLAGKVKIMIGGAPVNDAFRESIGADYYTPDASSAAEKALETAPRGRRKQYGNRGGGNPSSEGLPSPGFLPPPKTFDWWGGSPQETPPYGRNGAEAKRKPRRRGTRQRGGPPLPCFPPQGGSSHPNGLATPPPGGKETDMHSSPAKSSAPSWNA